MLVGTSMLGAALALQVAWPGAPVPGVYLPRSAPPDSYAEVWLKVPQLQGMVNLNLSARSDDVGTEAIEVLGVGRVEFDAGSRVPVTIHFDVEQLPLADFYVPTQGVGIMRNATGGWTVFEQEEAADDDAVEVRIWDESGSIGNLVLAGSMHEHLGSNDGLLLAATVFDSVLANDCNPTFEDCVARAETACGGAGTVQSVDYYCNRAIPEVMCNFECIPPG